MLLAYSHALLDFIAMSCVISPCTLGSTSPHGMQCALWAPCLYSAKCSLTLANTSSDGTLLKIGSDDYTHKWCELLTTVSTPIYSVMFTPTMQYTRYLRPEDD